MRGVPVTEGPTSVTDAAVVLPGIVAVAVGGTGARGTRVLHITAVLHSDLEGVVHVQGGHIGGRRPHPHSLHQGKGVGTGEAQKGEEGLRELRGVSGHLQCIHW